MKKIITVLSVLCLIFLAACGSASSSAGSEGPVSTPEITVVESAAPSPAPSEVVIETGPLTVEEDSVEVDEDNPVLNFVGNYLSDGYIVFIEAKGSKSCTASITSSVSSKELVEWSMSGPFDEETLSFSYDNCVKTKYNYGDDGFITDTVAEYENGTGKIAFAEDNTLAWFDDTEHIADGIIFSFSLGATEQWDLK